MVVNDLEAPAVRTIFDLYCTRKRLGAAAIGTLLTTRGQRIQAGKPWNTRAVLTVLRNRVYIGEIHYRGVWRTGTTRSHHPPIIDTDHPSPRRQSRRSALPGGRTHRPARPPRPGSPHR